MPDASNTWLRQKLFQSAPGREAGRCDSYLTSIVEDRWFQSAPGREAGRCELMRENYLALCEFQSAPGREAGRCAAGFPCSTIGYCFNPRPAVRPGDA